MNDQQLDILQIINLMFRAAAGGHYLDRFTTMTNESGGSMLALARLLAQTEEFQRHYPDMLSNAAFSSQLVENSVGSLVGAVDKSWAASEIERLLYIGMSRGDVI